MGTLKTIIANSVEYAQLTCAGEKRRNCAFDAVKILIIRLPNIIDLHEMEFSWGYVIDTIAYSQLSWWMGWLRVKMGERKRVKEKENQSERRTKKNAQCNLEITTFHRMNVVVAIVGLIYWQHNWITVATDRVDCPNKWKGLTGGKRRRRHQVKHRHLLWQQQINWTLNWSNANEWRHTYTAHKYELL